jgi:hypothetical protein
MASRPAAFFLYNAMLLFVDHMIVKFGFPPDVYEAYA